MSVDTWKARFYQHAHRLRARVVSAAVSVAAWWRELRTRGSHHPQSAIDAWTEWYRAEDAAGNIRPWREISRERHGDDCECTDCMGP